jgi:hypothetical protein
VLVIIIQSVIQFDDTYGTICHSFLNQRKSLAGSLKGLITKYPVIVEAIKIVLGDANSTFRSYSEKLKQIPPSATHHFDEVKLSEFF